MSRVWRNSKVSDGKKRSQQDSNSNVRNDVDVERILISILESITKQKMIQM